MSTRSAALADVIGEDGYLSLARALKHDGQTARLADEGELTGGRTPAKLAVIVIDDELQKDSFKIVLKRCPPPDGAPSEPLAHATALREANKFRRHLVEQLRPPIDLDDGGCLVLQRLAGGEVGGTLGSMLGGGRAGAHLPDACREVTQAVLHEWNPTAPGRPMKLSAFIGIRLGDRLSPGRNLHTWLDARPGSGPDQLTVQLPDGSWAPNPVALATGGFDGDLNVDAILGRAHGDLNLGNVLLPQRLQATDLVGFHLVDLAGYASSAPLTHDPAHLLLAVVGAELRELGAPARTATMWALLDAEERDTSRGSAVLLDTIREVTTVGRTWAKPSGRVKDWRMQTLLSFVTAGLMNAGRTFYLPDEREWFFLLAAHAGALYLDSAGVPVPAGATPLPVDGSDELASLLADILAVEADEGAWERVLDRLPPDLLPLRENDPRHHLIALLADHPARAEALVAALQAELPRSWGVQAFASELHARKLSEFDD
jgi:mRNA-degrading endonuclease toxin of MazEF toxin-antitoxin module